jgi:hypothetical protein
MQRLSFQIEKQDVFIAAFYFRCGHPLLFVQGPGRFGGDHQHLFVEDGQRLQDCLTLYAVALLNQKSA